MFKFNPFKRKKPVQGLTAGFPGANVPQTGELLENQLKMKIGEILVCIERKAGIPPTNELTAVIPRAEIRHRRYENGRLIAEEEIILSSITLVDAPLHPPENIPGIGRGKADLSVKAPAPSGTPAPPR